MSTATMTADSLAGRMTASDESIDEIRRRLTAAEAEAIDALGDDTAYQRAADKVASIALELQNAQQLRDRRLR